MANWLPAILAFVLPLLASAAGTGVLVHWLTRRQVLDRPNARSSHTAPTPRGGGIAVVAAVMAALWVIHLTGHLAGGGPLFRLAILTAAVAALAAVSWLDDLRGAGLGLRLAVQAVAVVAGLAVLDIAPLGDRLGMPAWLVGIVLALGWLWFVNLYNFMDGIDGITGVETASIGIGLVALAVVMLGAVGGLALSGLALAGAAVGFLLWNWHPARIFLGDVGSVPLGYIVGALLLQAAVAGYWAPALILALYYLADATLVLVRRALRGEKPWHAHRTHYYQRAVQGGLSHAQVSGTIAAANAGLIGLACLAALGWRWVALALAALLVAGVLAYFGSRRGAPRRATAAVL